MSALTVAENVFVDQQAELGRLMAKRGKVDDKISRLRAQIAHHSILVQRLSLPPEPQDEGAIVRFSKVFRGNPKTYKYAAIRTGGRWWATGNRQVQNVTWEQLVGFVRQDNMLTGSVPTEVDQPPF